MKRLLLLLACGGVFAFPLMADESDQAKAASLLAPLKQSLFQALSSAMPQGPLAALEVCHLDAQPLTEQAQTAGVMLGRTSDRLRNPANAAPEWVQPLLHSYSQAPSTEPLLHSLPDGRRGYVEPIFLAELCTACHGANLSSALVDRLDQLYPADRARGYASGDFRGLFWVELPADY